jgi:hypothetical protein
MYRYRANQSTLTDCRICVKNRSRPNTLDRFTDEYKDTDNYCEQYKTEVEGAGQFFCDYFDRAYQQAATNYPMQTCSKCGYYCRTYSEDESKTLCYECALKTYR